MKKHRKLPLTLAFKNGCFSATHSPHFWCRFKLSHSIRVLQSVSSFSCNNSAIAKEIREVSYRSKRIEPTKYTRWFNDTPFQSDRRSLFCSQCVCIWSDTTVEWANPRLVLFQT